MESNESVKLDYEDLLNICCFITNGVVKCEVSYDSLEQIKAFTTLLKSNIEIDAITIGKFGSLNDRGILNKDQYLRKYFLDFALEVKKSPHIKIVTILGCGNIDLSAISEFPSILIENQNFEEFSFLFYPIDLKLMSSLCKAIENHTSLDKLCLECSNVTKEYNKLLAESLIKNKTISDIQLSFDRNQECSSIFEALKDSMMLKEIHFTNGLYTPHTIKAFREMLLNTSLKTLYIYLEINSELIDDFFDAISVSKTLEEVTICGIHYYTKEYKTLEKMLLSCKKLVKFNINYGKINVDVCKFISKSLQNGCPAKCLGFMECGMDSMCASEIFKGLIGNKQVTTLEFLKNKLNNECSQAIIDTLKINKTITKINFRGSRIKRAAQSNIVNASLLSNPTRIIFF